MCWCAWTRSFQASWPSTNACPADVDLAQGLGADDRLEVAHLGTLPPRLPTQPSLSTDHHHGTCGAPSTFSTDGSQHEPGESAPPAGTDDEQVGVLRGVQQDPDRRSMNDVHAGSFGSPLASVTATASSPRADCSKEGTCGSRSSAPWVSGAVPVAEAKGNSHADITRSVVPRRRASSTAHRSACSDEGESSTPTTMPLMGASR
jgi:hypothetical protein